MTVIRVGQQEHGYRYGHEILASSLRLNKIDQDVIDRLSDISGPLRPNERFEPYLTAYPLPSREHYVLARTWQDREAPRAGCVLTRSILIPMKDWEMALSLADFVSLLLPVNRNDRSVEVIDFESTRALLPPVEAPCVSELVEAVFLESRQPIVIFEASEAEIIALRLLTALWPSMRRNFSVCTFALAPRTLADARSFDLLFAPKIARSHFSNWPGRRIEGVTSASTLPRHRWTSTTTKQIFGSPEPNLLALDALGALISDKRGDESSLRLSLLWNELIDKSKASPTAVLGLLDIISAQGFSFDKVANSLTPLMEQSVVRATSELPPKDAWVFLIALIGKFPQLLPPRSVIHQIKHSAFSLTKDNLGVAIEFVASNSDESRLIPAVVAAGVGDGLAYIGSEVLVEVVEKFEKYTLLRLVAYSRRFAALIAHSVDENTSRTWVKRIVDILETRETELRTRARRNILPHIRNSAQDSLLEAILFEISPKQLSTAVLQLWKSTKFAIASFDNIFLRAARSESGIINLREAILSVEETESSNRFLCSTLRLGESEIRWICTESGVSSRRQVKIIMQLITHADDQTLHAVAQQNTSSNLIVDILKSDSRYAATQLAKVLVAGQFDVDKLLGVGQEILLYTLEPTQTELANSMLVRGLSEENQQAKDILLNVISNLSISVDSLQVVHAATPANASWSHISDNIVLLGKSQGQIRAGVLWRIDLLTDRLVSKRGAGLSNQALLAWSELLAESGGVNKNAQIAAAQAIVTYAIRHTKVPVGPLLVESFPIVYEQLKRGKETPGLLSMFFFQDWDRCRTARENLVQAFMQSSWLPADILLAATKAGDAQRILSCISREYEGGRYIEAIAKDISRLPETLRHELNEQIEIFKGDLYYKQKR